MRRMAIKGSLPIYTHAPKPAVEALERLTVEQHVNWKKVVDQIKKLLEA